VLHHEYFLLSRQVAREALEVLFKKHIVFLSCGPYVLRYFLEKIGQQNGPGRQWLKWLKRIELDWVTFADLKYYPRDHDGTRYWNWQHDEEEVDVDYVRGAQYNGHYDEHDLEGGYYDDDEDDDLNDPSDTSLLPSFRRPATTEASSTNDPFGFANHYPFVDPSYQPGSRASPEHLAKKLDLLVSLEVTPLFTYLASPTFNFTSITLPLYFISKESHQHRRITRPGFALPLKVKYWMEVCAHALLMLKAHRTRGNSEDSSLQEVRVKYLPWDIWASMDPVDDLRRLCEKGVWFDGPEDGAGGDQEREGEAFRGVWAAMRSRLSPQETEESRMGLSATIRFVPWDGNVDSSRVGDELEVVFTRASVQPDELVIAD
jgi:hypothetical protein